MAHQTEMKKRASQPVSTPRLPLPLLVILWLLVKIGQLPISAVFAVINGVQLIRHHLEIPTYRLDPKKTYSRVKPVRLPHFHLEMPKLALPKLPKISMPAVSFPNVPSLPKFSLPKLPQVNLEKRRGRPALKTTKKTELRPSFSIARSLSNLSEKVGRVLATEIHIPLPHLAMPSVKLPDMRRDRRGRPRTQPFFQFYKRKAKRALNKIFPRPLRWAAAFLVIFALIFTYSFYLIELAHSLPSPDQLTYVPQPKTTEIYDKKGKMLYQIYEGQNRKLVTLDKVPSNLVKATIAIEDKNFYNHPGVDFFGILRAAKTNYDTGQLQGGSTITQQLIKNTLLTTDKTLNRKLKEALLAFWAERVFSKEQILQMYFNEIAYGGTAWGAEAASQTYFNKSVSDLDLAESAYLAGLPAAPSDYSPFGPTPTLGKERQREVLKRMVEDGYINQDQADQAYAEEMHFASARQDIKAPHFVMYIRSVLANKYGERTVSQGGLKVMTTLDADMQEMAQGIVSREVNKLANLRVGNGAAMITDAKTGHILAMVGSKDYFDPKEGNFNVALALRQPGSSIKPITYATGFKMGFSPGSVLLDTPTTFVNPYGANYSPVNYDGKFHGAVSVRTSLGSSYNIPAVKMLAMVGIPNMIQTAQDLGITTLTDTKNYGLSLTLGGGAVPMIQMMSAYNTFSQNGVRYPISGIMTVTDSNGNLLEDNRQPEGDQAIQPEIAYLISHVLADGKAREPAFGPRSTLEIPGKTVAVKTGTSDDKRDNWTFGYTPEYVVGTWVGNNDNSPMDPALTSGVTGASQIWHDIMVTLTRDRPNLAFERPAGVVEGTVDGRRDLVMSGQTQKSAVTLNKTQTKEATSGAVRDTITYSDSFSWGVVPKAPNR